TSEEASYHFNSINELSSKIEQTPGSPTLYFARGLDYALVQDINNALDNLDKAIEAKPDFVLAYFERANLRYRKINVEYAENQNESETVTMAAKVVATSPLTARSKKGSSLEGISFGEKTFGMDYELVIRDYEKVLSLDPKFIYAWFNRGNIRCLQRDYRNALIDFGKAIELNPDFAEAWFNRGITQIYLGDRAHGISDLRMAGQLGLYKAYNLIKRFEDKTMD
ncbi:MAG: tetratricopeptide repeat protein, partial [Bacteroidota bacterium]|nr:tetratricopeptide repeat protein [Bacteroidota bacterium]